MSPALTIRPYSEGALSQAAAKLRAGELVAFPTETVYGLGADATNADAVAGIYAAKKRPSFNPLISHFPDRDAAAKHAVFDARADKLASAFWPGALTLVLPRQADSDVCDLVTAGLPSIAVRVPAHPMARELLRAVGRPVAAPSANRSGKISPTTAAHVAQSLGNAIGMILDGGPCGVGLESTVIDLTTDRVVMLRPGGVTADQVSELLGTDVVMAESDDTAPKSPGMMTSHYAPGLPVRLDATTADPAKYGHEVLLGFGDCNTKGFDAVLWLSKSGNDIEAAANLFAKLHEADQSHFAGIAIAPIPDLGLGIAINDRLKRASAPRAPHDAK
ncbi:MULTISPECIES: L-threonylcarbamoyladenylate synthase [unclassified Thalassospira]|uniref:L-threonylcarbamoyladenylate synthase n=1 Tax=unclassified Thalassospira TaxID=2648997 RepID=UPI0007A5E003|nr:MULTISPECIES: L-threonylcarbamoyladenylate synthase [unclassified Thalassospira]KZD00977.1 translation factor Sua5 [Thalassospira sp. MCCC 1A02898]ONH87392.1 translation factor Sua5 [Thalassospira sp. MCCC 1A02803]